MAIGGIIAYLMGLGLKKDFSAYAQSAGYAE